jgi:hypothetical protein
MTGIGELGTTLAATINRQPLLKAVTIHSHDTED